jgi:hypothetical protein
MNAFIIADLNHSQDLDREALAAISGSAGLAMTSASGGHYKEAEITCRSIDFGIIKEFDVVDAIIRNVSK